MDSNELIIVFMLAIEFGLINLKLVNPLALSSNISLFIVPLLIIGWTYKNFSVGLCFDEENLKGKLT